MATGNYGVIGPFTGRIGPVTGYMRNGKNILRSSTSIVKDKLTPLRATQRQKLSTCNRFTKAFAGTGFFNKTFPAYGQAGTGYNRVTSALMSRAVTGVYPDMYLDYTQVLVSKGRLPGAVSAKVSVKNSIIHFSFADNSGDGIAAANDSLILVAFAPDLQQAILTLHGGFRKDKKAVLNVTAFKGHSVETWIGFLSKDEKDVSDSVWAGRVLS
jgi:hypothetical protein